MKTCPNCGNKYSDGENFCTSCGTPLTADSKADTADSESLIKSPQPPAWNPAPMPGAPRKKSNALKVVGITLVVLVIGAFLVYNHLKNSTTYLRLSPEGLEFPKQGGVGDAQIDYDGYMWKVNYVPNWCTVYEGDAYFTVSCDKNTTGQDREDYITVSSGKVIQRLYVGQHAHATFIELSESSLSVGRSGGSVDVTINSDGSDFEYRGPADVCTVTDDSDEGFKLEFATNDGYGRSGTVEVVDGDQSASIRFYQKGICRYCDGTGSTTCYSCGGQGYVSNWFYGGTSVCSTCNGTGKVTCSYCNGTGEE